MLTAWLVTALALCGVWVGVFVSHESNRFQDHLAAAGGGLLVGISLFWLVPEIGETTGKPFAVIIAVAVAGVLMLLDTVLEHGGHSAHQGVVWPLLLATVLHSLLDGWAVRLLSVHPLTNVAVAVGLALHKIPEGVAVGWIARRSMGNPRQAFVVSAFAELFTIVGAAVEPGLNASGAARFGLGWSSGVFAVIAGGFLFLGAHAIVPSWRRYQVVLIFVTTFLLVGALTFLRAPV